MEKIDIKELVGYIPYNVRIKNKTTEKPLGGYDIDSIIEYPEFWDYKLLLNKLSDMYKIEEIMDEFSEYSLEQFEFSFFTELGRCGNCFDFVTHSQMQLFYKYHLDIFGLVEKGHAIYK